MKPRCRGIVLRTQLYRQVSVWLKIDLSLAHDNKTLLYTLCSLRASSRRNRKIDNSLAYTTLSFAYALTFYKPLLIAKTKDTHSIAIKTNKKNLLYIYTFKSQTYMYSLTRAPLTHVVSAHTTTAHRQPHIR